MKELNLFRKFISEEKETKVSEDKIEAAIKATLKKEGGAAGIDPLKKAVKDLNVDTDFDIEKFLKKMSNVEKHKNGDYILTPLKENDSLEEVKEEQTNEIFGKKGEERIKISNDMKIGKALSALEDALFELNFLGVISDNDYNNFWMDKYGELYMDTMGQLDPTVQKKYDYEGLEEDEKQNQTVKNADPRDDQKYKNQLHQKLDLDENDSVLDEIINEAKPNLKKALPKIAARNVERNNNINFDIESMMDMVGEAGKGEDSKEAKILFKASNASSDLEQALVDLQVYFEDDLGEGKEEE